MPRRTAQRCPIRTANDEMLREIVEFNLTNGDCFGHWDLRTRAEFARPWAVWGNEITKRWRAGFPGSRPMAAYILGEIPPPAWKNDLPSLRHPLRQIEGCEIEIADVAWHKTAIELEHLDSLGLISAKEWREAELRFAETDWLNYHNRYSPIATK